ncbi:MAG: hypothetical protein IGR92_05920 [Leptolyngbyaceae cyanobacterium T60_A2020_046]|nr:hypothetical protein [Leptolyngbyaceae cyanobacterium T60_A2020_046]
MPRADNGNGSRAAIAHNTGKTPGRIPGLGSAMTVTGIRPLGRDRRAPFHSPCCHAAISTAGL